MVDQSGNLLDSSLLVRQLFNYFPVSAVTEEQEAKLNKLLRLWESKSNYFDSAVIEKMKSPTTSYQEYQNNLIAQHSNAIAHLTQQTKATFEKYVNSHLTSNLSMHRLYLNLVLFQLPDTTSSFCHSHYATNTTNGNAETCNGVTCT